MTDLSQAIWRKARRSAHNGGCVEIAANLDGVAAVRDSKRPEGGAHVVARAAFAAFLADVKDGRYNMPSHGRRKAPRWMQPLGGLFDDGPVSRPGGSPSGFPHHPRLYTAARINGQLRTATQPYATNHPKS
jgi:hypothetical protein